MSGNHLTSHQIGSKAGTQIVKDSLNAGIDWPDTIIACETAVAIVVAAIIQMTEPSDGRRLATELVDVLTERAHARVTAMLKGVPYEG
jgi:hypothetical protein